MADHQYYNGVLLFHKPAGMTSHDAVQGIRKVIRQRRVGHTGTLDPLAEGLLLVCLGRATKIVRFLTEFDKTYEAEIRLGHSTSTFDAEGVFLNQRPFDIPRLREKELESLLDKYRGRFTQTVPAYSAVRVNGQRLHSLARRNIKVDLPEREVEISKLELIGFEAPSLHLRVTCSKGTFIRALANDIGRDLGCGAYLAALKRTRVGKFDLEQALDIDQFTVCHMSNSVNEKLLSYDDVLIYDSITVTDDFRKMVLAGRTLTPADCIEINGDFEKSERIVLKDRSGDILAIGTAERSADRITEAGIDEKLFTYIRVLN